MITIQAGSIIMIDMIGNEQMDKYGELIYYMNRDKTFNSNINNTYQLNLKEKKIMNNSNCMSICNQSI